MKTTFVLVSLCVLLGLALTGCGAPPECEADTDCPVTNNCMIPRCNGGTCQSIIKPDCCGNLQCEPGEECTCEKDCKGDQFCGGIVKTPHPSISGRFLDAKYAQHYCDSEGTCVVGVPPKDVQTTQLFSSHLGEVEFEVTTTIDQPFVVGQGDCSVRVKLVDMKSTATTPITITSLQALSGNELLAEKTVKEELTSIGSTYETALVLTPSMKSLEEEIYLTIRFNYEYSQIVREESKVVRTYVEKRYTRLNFIEPRKAP